MDAAETTIIGMLAAANAAQFATLVRLFSSNKKEVLRQAEKHKDELVLTKDDCAKEKEKLLRETLMAVQAQAKALSRYGEVTRRRKKYEEPRLLPESTMLPPAEDGEQGKSVD